MNASVKIAQWVNNKPIILIRFDKEISECLLNSKQGFEHLTIAKLHRVFQNFKLPTLCILEVQDRNITHCYLGVATRKRAVSTFESSLTIKKLRSITPLSLHEIEEAVTDNRMKQLLRERLPDDRVFSNLSPKLSSYLVELLAQNSKNHIALNTAFSLLPKLRCTPNTNWAQEDAIHLALAAFGIRTNITPNSVILKSGTISGLSRIAPHLYEDNVVHADASKIPGFDAIAPDITGKAVFEKGDERLVIYTANKLPLEKMLGVDLIYINETRGNIIMIQYKMLEEFIQDGESRDWIFRPDKQLKEEISRMQLPKFQRKITDYRLNRNPFYFKFVKRKIVDDSHQSLLIALDHLKLILKSPELRGSKGGIRLSYEALNGTYLRETDMISLIRSGYIGTHRIETEMLKTIISEGAKGNKTLVLAWQRKVRGEAT